MKSVVEILEERIAATMKEITGSDECMALIRHTADPKLGDYQANGVMAIAKKLKMNPRQLAIDVVSSMKVDEFCEGADVAGPGFINLWLRAEYLESVLLEINSDTSNRLGVDKTETPKTVVVDFSGPNIAKQMHVGHLRSTIIGDCICRLLEFQGNNVIRQNHIGDWGTQFGMLIAYLRDTNPEILVDPDSVKIANLEEFYKQAKARCDEDEDFAAAARQEVVNLHSHNSDTITIWQHIVDESRKHYQPIYDRLGAGLGKDNERGESFYRDKLGAVVDELSEKNYAKESLGAMCVFLDGFLNKHGEPLPFIIRKTDGAFLYATTDLAAIKYRVDELGAQRIIYVTDARQQLHFQMLFATVQLAGWVADDTQLEHVTFGTVLGEDGKPFKTRSGENVKLSELLAEAVDRAREVVEEKNPGLWPEQKDLIAEAVGIGAVKYADFSNNRTSDYIFSFDKMLAMEGNTAPYMQYAFARIRSIERKAADKGIDVSGEISGIGANKLNLVEPAELELAKYLIRYCDAIKAAGADCRPNYLTSYLYELAQKFSSFYSACPVIADEKQRPTRLLLCDLTARTIKHGLSVLLGIDVVEQM